MEGGGCCRRQVSGLENSGKFILVPGSCCWLLWKVVCVWSWAGRSGVEQRAHPAPTEQQWESAPADPLQAERRHGLHPCSHKSNADNWERTTDENVVTKPQLRLGFAWTLFKIYHQLQPCDYLLHSILFVLVYSLTKLNRIFGVLRFALLFSYWDGASYSASHTNCTLLNEQSTGRLKTRGVCVYKSCHKMKEPMSNYSPITNLIYTIKFYRWGKSWTKTTARKKPPKESKSANVKLLF